MLREAVNLSPDAKQAPALTSPADADEDSTDSETDMPAAPAHSCYLGQRQSHGSAEEDWQQHQQQQGQEAGRATALMRDAYKEMLLQQQSRHRTELERRQAKYQRQLDTQVSLQDPTCCTSVTPALPNYHKRDITPHQTLLPWLA